MLTIIKFHKSTFVGNPRQIPKWKHIMGGGEGGNLKMFPIPFFWGAKKTCVHEIFGHVIYYILISWISTELIFCCSNN